MSSRRAILLAFAVAAAACSGQPPGSEPAPAPAPEPAPAPAPAPAAVAADACPRCQGREILPILYGYLDAAGIALVEQGKAAAGGCYVGRGMPDTWCRGCGHEWCRDATPAPAWPLPRLPRRR